MTAPSLYEFDGDDGTMHPAEQLWTPGEDAVENDFIAHRGLQAAEHTQRLLEQLTRCTTRTDGQVAVARRLLADHPDLPLSGFTVSHTLEPEPGKPQHWLILRVGEHDTNAITTWAKALDTEPVIDGARHTLTTTLHGIGIRASATIPEDAYDLEGAVFTPTPDDVTGTYRGLLMTEIGEDGDLLIIGHPPARDVLAITSAYYRNTCGQRLRPLDGDDLTDSITRSWGRFVAYPTRTNWTVHGVSEGTPGALPITWLSPRNADTQDLACHIERCPSCQRPSRGLDYDPVEGHRVHVCPSPACQHQWPTHSPSSTHTKGHP